MGRPPPRRRSAQGGILRPLTTTRAGGEDASPRVGRVLSGIAGSRRRPGSWKGAGGARGDAAGRHHGARTGARYAIVHGSDNLATTAQIQTVVKNFLSTAPVDATRPGITIDVNYPTCNAPGCKVTVTATYPYDPLISYFPWPAINLKSTSQGVITF